MVIQKIPKSWFAFGMVVHSDLESPTSFDRFRSRRISTGLS